MQLVDISSIKLQPTIVSEYFEEEERTHRFFNDFVLFQGFAIQINDTYQMLLRSNSAHIFTYDASPADGILFFVTNLLPKNAIDPETAFHIITLYEQFHSDDKVKRKIYSQLNWPSSSKGHDYFHVYEKLSTKLRFLLSTKKISLQEAFLFHRYFKTNYDELLNLLTVQGNFSDNSTNLRLATEIAQKHNLSTTEIIIQIQHIQQEQSVSLPQALHLLRMPFFSALSEKYKHIVGQLQLPPKCTITTDQSFEKNYSELTIQFSTKNELIEKLEKCVQKLKIADNEKDYLNLELLAKEVMEKNHE